MKSNFKLNLQTNTLQLPKMFFSDYLIRYFERELKRQDFRGAQVLKQTTVFALICSHIKEPNVTP